MDVMHLLTFVQLVRHRSFSRVANDLGVTQPTVTFRIKSLEEELGTPLIVRMGHKIAVTPAGKVFYENTERSLRVLKHGLRVTKGGEVQSNRLSVAAPTTVSTYLLPRFITQYYLTHKNTQIFLETVSSNDVIEMILDQVAEIGFIQTSVSHPDLIRIPLGANKYYLLSHPDHPLTKRSRIKIYDLRYEPLITPEKNTNMYYRINNLFSESNVCSEISMNLRHAESIKHMVLEGNGIAFLPWLAIKDEVKRNKLTILPLQLNHALEREISVIYHKKNENSIRRQYLLQILQQIKPEFFN